MGPLGTLRVLELASIVSVPFAGALLGDLGADVVRIDRVALAGVPGSLRRSLPMPDQHGAEVQLDWDIVQRRVLLFGRASQTDSTSPFRVIRNPAASQSQTLFK